MTTEWKPRIDAEMPDPPTSYRLDMDDLMTEVGRARRRRTLIGGGGSAVAVAAIAAITLFAATGTTPTTPDETRPANPTSSDETTAPRTTVTLPELDPDEEYEWSYSGWGITTNDTTMIYTDALETKLEEMYPGIAPEHGDPSDFAVIAATEDAQLQQYLRASPGGGEVYMPVHTQRVYRVGHDIDNGVITSPKAVFPGNQFSEELDITFWPSGGFTTGTDGPTDLISCASDVDDETDYDGSAITAVECSESTGPNGELIRHATSETSRASNGDTYWRDHTTVVYRTDGTAIAFTLHIKKEWEMGVDPTVTSALSDLGDRTPSMSFADQVELILALPQEPIE